MHVLRITLTTVLIVCAVIITALVIRRELFLSHTPDRQPGLVLPDSLWQVVSVYHTASGPRSAPVKLVEFYDYECPSCRRFHPVLDFIHTKYPEEVSLIYRHFPMNYHAGAYHAAIAAECAGEQGTFKAYHDLLFANQDQLSDSTMNWTALAQIAGMPNIDQFQTCVTDTRTRHKVNADTALVHVLGISSIPTLFVNGSMYSGAMSVPELDAIVQKALNDAD